MGMTERKIVKRLEYCIENKCDICQEIEASGFPWIDGRCYGFTERLYDALALLKAQEPRVMTIDEVGTWVMIDRVDRAPIVVEVRNRFIAWVVGDEYYDLPECESLNLSSEFYNKTWRCWSSWPTTGQMEAVKWE